MEVVALVSIARIFNLFADNNCHQNTNQTNDTWSFVCRLPGISQVIASLAVSPCVCMLCMFMCICLAEQQIEFVEAASCQARAWLISLACLSWQQTYRVLSSANMSRSKYLSFCFHVCKHSRGALCRYNINCAVRMRDKTIIVARLTGYNTNRRHVVQVLDSEQMCKAARLSSLLLTCGWLANKPTR